MPDTQLQQIMQTSKSEEIRKLAAEVLAEHKMDEQADKTVQPPPPPPPQQMAQAPAPASQGIAAAPAPSMETMATGGIIAFAGDGPEGSAVKDPNFDPRLAAPSQYLDTIKDERAQAGVTGRPYDEYSKYISDQMAKLPDIEKNARDRSAFQYFTNLMTQTGPFLNAAGKAAVATQPDIEKRIDKAKELGATYNKAKADIAQAGRLEDLGMVKDANDMRKTGVDLLNRKDVAEIGARASYAATMKPTDLDKTTTDLLNEMLAKGAPNNAATKAAARTQAYALVGLAGQKVDASQEAAITQRIKSDALIGDNGTLKLKLLQAQQDKDPSKAQAIQKQIDDREITIRKGMFGGTPSPAGGNPAPGENNPLPKAPDISTVKGAPEGATVGAFVQGKGYEIRDKAGKLVGYAQS
jgi:hypothetical protein